MTFGILCGKMYVTPSVIYDNKSSRVLIQKFTKSIIYSFMTTLRAINNPFFLKSIILTTLNTGSRNYSQRTKVLSKI